MAAWSSKKPKATEKIQGAEHRQKMMSGVLVSFIVHLTLLIALSLVAVGTPVQETMSLLFAEVASPELEDFALVDATPIEAVAPGDSAELQEPEAIDLVTSNSNLSLASTKQPVESASAPKTEESNEDGKGNSSNLGIDAAGTARRVAAIQSRVGKAGGKKGEVQFALAWKNVNDVDIHVIAPSGEHISHMHRRSQCNGMLDVDMNVRGESSEPVENVRWINNAPWGRYTVLVHLFKLNPDGPRRPKRQSEFHLMAQLGNETTVQEGVLSIGNRQVFIYRYQYVSDKASPGERQQLLSQMELLQQREEAAAKPMLEEALAANEKVRDRKLENIVRMYPHTDAAIEALQSIGGDVVKH